MINALSEAEALCVISALVMVLPGGVTPDSTCHVLRHRWHHVLRTDFDCRKSSNLRFVASDIGRHSQFVMYWASMTEDESRDLSWSFLARIQRADSVLNMCLPSHDQH